MGKFKMSLKIQGFELDIDGDRPDISAISNAVSQQITGILAPAAALASGAPATPTPPIIEAESENGKKPGRFTRKKPSTSRSSEPAGEPIEFRHDPARFGNPLQSWTLTQKTIWLLAVLKGLANTTEASTAQLAATFNEKFKQAGLVRVPNLARYLGESRMQNPAPINEHEDKWFLTQEGERVAQELIQSVLAPAS